MRTIHEDSDSNKKTVISSNTGDDVVTVPQLPPPLHDPFVEQQKSIATNSIPAHVATARAKDHLRKQITQRLAALPYEYVGEQAKLVHEHLFRSELYQQSTNICVYVSCHGNPLKEIDTIPIIHDILAASEAEEGTEGIDENDNSKTVMKKKNKKKLFVPYIEDFNKCKMTFVRVYSRRDLEENFIKNRYDILEPKPESVSAREDVLRDNILLDLIIVPGLAFEKTGARMGRGKGYYDRFLNLLAERIRNANKALLTTTTTTTTLATKKHMTKIAYPKTIGLCLHEQIVEDGQVPMDYFDRRLDYIITPLDGLSSSSNNNSDNIVGGVNNTVQCC